MSRKLLEGIYCGRAPDPAELWRRCNLDPALRIALTRLALVLGRSRPGLLAVGVLAVALVSPLCALLAALFSARVAHHVLLVAAAVVVTVAALARPTGDPELAMSAFLVSASILWAWHWPALYDVALSWAPTYWAMQLSLLATATALCGRVLHPRQIGGHALLLILRTYMQMGLLGALLIFAPEALYAIHATAPLAWGFSPLADQQLGGLLMWAPAGLPFVAWGAWIARREWQATAERPA